VPREPKVVADDLIAILNRYGYFAPSSGKEGLPLAPLAEQAKIHPTTLSKLLRHKWKTIDLGLADRLCVALGASVNECRLDPPDEG